MFNYMSRVYYSYIMCGYMCNDTQLVFMLSVTVLIDHLSTVIIYDI